MKGYEAEQQQEIFDTHFGKREDGNEKVVHETSCYRSSNSFSRN